VTIQDARPDTKLTLVNSFGLSAVLFIRRFSGGVADWRVYQPLAGLSPNSYMDTLMNSPCSKLQGITSAPLCFADKVEYNFTLNPSHAASSGEFKFKIL